MSDINSEILDMKNCYSKTLKAIDAKIKFQQDEEEYFDNLKKEFLLRKREKQLKYIKNQQHENIIRGLKKLEEETKKDIHNKFKQVSLSSAINRIISLPKMSRYKNEIQDNKTKEDYNLIKFEKVWKDQYMNDIKYNKKTSNNKMLFGRIYFTDIFDKNYDKFRKHLEESKEKNMRIERVKINNLKVSRKLNIHKQIMLRFQDHREYKPNYSVIERHKPVVKLDSKSTRLFLRHINPVTVPNLSSFKSRNNNNKKNETKRKIIRSLSEFQNNLNAKNILVKSHHNINNIDKNNIWKRKLLISTLNIKPKEYKTLMKDNNNIINHKNIFTTQKIKKIKNRKITSSTLNFDISDLRLKI